MVSKTSLFVRDGFNGKPSQLSKEIQGRLVFRIPLAAQFVIP